MIQQENCGNPLVLQKTLDLSNPEDLKLADPSYIKAINEGHKVTRQNIYYRYKQDCTCSHHQNSNNQSLQGINPTIFGSPLHQSVVINPVQHTSYLSRDNSSISQANNSSIIQPLLEIPGFQQQSQFITPIHSQRQTVVQTTHVMNNAGNLLASPQIQVNPCDINVLQQSLQSLKQQN